jgi:hypothetical protein
MLLASSAPGLARAADAGPAPTTQLDITGLLYGEAQRVDVVEPTGRLTRLYSDGQSFFFQFGVDAITGASPSGALPSGQTQTVTSASGNTTTRTANQIPLVNFHDTRLAFDGGWVKPFGLFTSTLGGHYSREKDYQSLGASGKLSVDLFHRMTTLTVGAGVNQDEVFPVGGTTVGLADPNAILGTGQNSKHVFNGMLGVSRVLTRRWLMAVTASHTSESGYLTEPYKVLSVVDQTTGFTVGDLTEKRPSTRERTSVLGSSIYHFAHDVLSTSYRFYWDDWKVRSHTIDLKYRHDLSNDVWLEPHLRYYTQNAASFFRFGLIQGDPLPEFATSDYRLGSLSSVTAGATLGFRFEDFTGEWRVRLEYIGQFSDGHPKDAVGVQRGYDIFPTVNIGSLVVDYSIKF